MKNHKVNRRDATKVALAGAATAAFSSTGFPQVHGAESNKTRVKIAGYAYDRVRAIQDGRLSLDGFDTSFHVEDIYALNKHLFGSTQKYEVSETGLIPFVNKYANDGFRGYTLIPVFISRLFRHRNIFVRTDRGINKPEDLRGKRVATPGYGMSSQTWIRGFLQDVHGVKPADMKWIETTESSGNRQDHFSSPQNEGLPS